MNYCLNCGAVLEPDKRFCTTCGTKIEETSVLQETPVQASMQQQTVPVQTSVQQPAQSQIQSQPAIQAQPTVVIQPAPVQTVANTDIKTQVQGSKYEPVTTGGFIGLSLLMLLPGINLILLIVWTCGGCRKLAKTYWARANLILMLIGILLSVILGIAGRAVIKKVVPASLTGETRQYERLIEAVESGDRQALMDMGYSEKEIDEVLENE